MAEPAALPAPETQALYSPETGERVEVPVEAVGALVRSGKLGFAKGETVYVNTPDGVAPLSGEQAAHYFGTLEGLDGDAASAGAFQKQEERKGFETFGQEAAGAGLGVARGLSLGTLDYLAPKAAGLFDDDAAASTRAYLKKQEEYNPGLSTAGELAGIALPAFVSGGAAGGIRGGLAAVRGASGALETGAALGRTGLALATAPARAASAIGRGVEGLAGAGLGSGALGRGLASALGAGAENAIYGAGMAVGQAGLANDDLTAERVLAGGAMGGALGFGVGGALSLAGSAARAIASKAAEHGEGLALALGRRATGYGENAAARGMTEGEAFLADGMRDQSLRATGASQAMRGELGAMGPAMEDRVVADLHGDVTAAAGKSSFEKVSRPEMADAYKSLVTKRGQALDAQLKELDALNTGIKPDAYRAMNEAVNDVLRPLEAKGAIVGDEAKAVESQIEKLADSVHAKGFLDFRNVRSAFDKKIAWQKTQGNTIVVDALKEVRGIFENELERAGEQAAKKAGGSFAAAYKEAKESFRAALWGQKATKLGAQRDLANATGGLREQLGTLGGANAGGHIGEVAGSVLGPVGSFIGHGVGNIVGGLAAATVAHYGRLYGNQAAAVIAQRAAHTNLVHAIASTVDTRLAKALDSFFGQGKRLSGGRAAAPLLSEGERVDARSQGAKQKRFDEQRAALASFLASGGAPAREHVASLASSHSELANAVQQKSVVAAQYLQSKLPPDTVSHQTLTPQLDKPRVPPDQAEKWLRIHGYVTDPTSVLAEMAKGRITRAGVDVLKAVYPAMYQGLRDGIVERLTTLKKPLDYTQQQQLSLLLDIDTRPCMTAEFVQSQQAAYASAAAPAPAGPPRPAASGGAGSAIANLADTARTGAQKTGGHL